MVKEEPYRLHAAIFNSLRTLDALGATNELVMSIDGHYSRTLNNTQKKTSSVYIKEIMVNMNELVNVRWTCDCVEKCVTVKQLLDDIYNVDGVPDVILRKITFALPYSYQSQYSLGLINSWLTWMFSPYTFRKGMWERLKATEFPGQKLYMRYMLLRKEICKTMDKETAKRWRDTLMMNRPHEKLDNQEIRSIWGDKHWALMLKEMKGNFELMDMGESR